MLRGKLESWLLIPTLALLWAAGAIDEDDLAHWMAVKDGEKLLGAYLADPERPLVLRAVATNNLFQMGQTAQIVGVIKDATPNDRKAVLPYITQVILTKLNDPTRKDVQGTAARVALYLMEFTDELEGENAKGEPYGEALLRLSVDWCLDQLDQEAPQEQAKRCDRILLAAAVARPDFSVPRIVDYMRSATDLNRLLLVDAILSRLRDAAVERQQAAALLKFARSAYPALPQSLAEALIHNGDDTLLLFLLDAVRDPRVPAAVRDIALEETTRRLKKKALPGLFRLLANDEPESDFLPRFNAIQMIWDLGNVEHLGPMLRALPADKRWPTSKDAFKAEVGDFCESNVALHKVAARPALVDALADPNWVARAYALECVLRLYPDEARDLTWELRADQTPLPGWLPEGAEVTIGAYVTEATDKG